MAKMKLHNIPYRGSSPALQGLIAVDIDLMFDNLGVSLPLIMSGKLKLLAVASPRRRRCPTCRRSLNAAGF
jgi:tripartite-type tricarboxylate transporter receptor subunit TctC